MNAVCHAATKARGGACSRGVAGFGGLLTGLLLLSPSPSPGFILTVPRILDGPQDAVVAQGQPALFSVVVAGSPPPLVQWLRNGVAIPGATGGTLSFNAAVLADEGAYGVVVSNVMGRVFSPPAFLTVRAPPQFVVLPSDRTAALGSKVALEAEVSGSAPLSFQWFHYGQVVAGQTGESLVFENVQVADAGPYQLRVSNGYGTNSSQTVLLEVVVPPVLTGHPQGVTLGLGQSLQLCVDVDAFSPVQFQWRRNGVNIPGAVDDCFFVQGVRLADAGSYTVVVYNSAGTVESDPALVQLDLPDLDAGDEFEKRIPLTINLGRGHNRGATKELGEPDHAGQAGGRSVWYSRYAQLNGLVTLRTVGSNFDTLLAVYTGDSLGTLDLVTSNEDDGNYFTSSVQFQVEPGVEYLVAVDGFGGASGDFVLEWLVESTDDPLPEIVQDLQSMTVAEQAFHEFKVVAQGDNLQFAWFHNGQRISGEDTDTLTLPAVSPLEVGTYRVEVRNGFGRSVLSSPAVLEIGPEPTFQSLAKVPSPDGAGGDPNGLALVAGLTQSVSGGGLGLQVSAGTLGTQVLNTTNSMHQSGEPNHCGTLGTSTRWIILRTEEAGLEFVVDTIGSSIPTVLAVYSRETVLDPLVSVECDAGTDSSDTVSRVQFPADAGLDYWIAVDGLDGAEGVVQLNWRLGRLPVVTASPSSPTSPLLGDHQWRVLVEEGIPPSQVSWLLDGTSLFGATDPYYPVADAGTFDAGTYTVVVSNFMGAVQIDVATLAVDPMFITLAESTFETDAEGWQVLSGLGVESPDHSPAAGLEDGSVEYAAGTATGSWFWSAPEDFLGNLSGAYGGRLECERFTTATGGSGLMEDVALVGGGLVLVADLPTPGTTWNWQSVPLVAGSDWHLENLSGPAATLADLLQVLGALEAVLIRGGFGPDAHVSGLDTVRWVGPVSSDVVVLEALREPGDLVRLRWPDCGAAFQLEGAADAASGGWAPVVLIPSVADGFREVVVSTSGGDRTFFRLRKP